MQPISSSPNCSVHSMSSAQSAGQGRITKQPSTGPEGAAGPQAAHPAHPPQGVGAQNTGFSVENVSGSSALGVQENDEAKKLAGLSDLLRLSFHMNAELPNGSQVNAYTQAAGGADGGCEGAGGVKSVSVGISVDFSA